MEKNQRLFVVVDPTNAIHATLERAIRTSSLRKATRVIKVFITVDADAVDTRAVNSNLFRDQAWFDSEIKKPLEDAGIEYSIEISWSSEWQKSIVMAAKQFRADHIYLPVQEKEGSARFMFSESKWDLLKTANCPVVLIRPQAPKQRKTVLAAVNFQAIEDEQIALNKCILNRAQEIADMYGAEVHLVNAYLDSMNYPDRGRLANETGLPSNRIHVPLGYTDEAVSKVADEIGADLVVMGTLGQNGLIKSRRGNTAARVISALKQDIMVVNH